MGVLGAADILLFGGFRLDRQGGGLFRLDPDGRLTPVALGSRALDLLAFLADRSGEVVLKSILLAAVWPGKIVEEANLNVQISKLRRILDSNPKRGSSIQTITGYGYRFVAPVTRLGSDRPRAVPVLLSQARPAVTPATDYTGSDTTTPLGRLMLTVLQGLAQFERDMAGK